MPPMPRAKSVEIVEPPPQGMIGKLHPVVPFPERPGGLARLLEQVGYGSLVQVHPLSSRRGAVNPAANVMTAR